jgi:uncharacterized repeat protein (TIGR03803 family)
MSRLTCAACFVATAAFAGAAPAVVSARAAPMQFQVLYSFRGGNDGALPAAGLMTDTTGAFYGTTQSGGLRNMGTAFRLTRSGSGYAESVLHAFAGGKHDGAVPVAGLIEDRSGVLYGTTEGGGNQSYKRFCRGSKIRGCGTVFRLTRSGSGYAESLIYAFRDDAKGDGMFPYAGLIAGEAGALYGTTYFGGGQGNVIELTPTRKGYTEASLYAFQYSPSGEAFPDGALPAAGLLADGSGALYGTTVLGGDCPVEPLYGCGVVFKLTPSASGYTFGVLYAFQGGDDGNWPVAGLIADKNGALYGTTQYGGTASDGTVFKLTPAGSRYSETVLHDFAGGSDGALPVASLTSDKRGALYGTTAAGGSANSGTIFTMTPSASGYSERVLHSFRGGSDGADPVAKLIVGKTGALYGTTQSGGTYGVGTVFAFKR